MALIRMMGVVFIDALCQGAVSSGYLFLNAASLFSQAGILRGQGSFSFLTYMDPSHSKQVKGHREGLDLAPHKCCGF